MFVPKKRKQDCISRSVKRTNNNTPINEKRMCDAPETHRESVGGYLSNCDILLHPASLSNKRKTLFEKQITVNAGHLITNLSSLKDSETPIVLIDDDLLDPSRIDQMIKKIEESANLVR